MKTPDLFVGFQFKILHTKGMNNITVINNGVEKEFCLLEAEIAFQYSEYVGRNCPNISTFLKK